MEKDSPSKPSVAELAGRFKGHILPMPNQHDQLPFRRKPPCSLKLRNPADGNEESDRAAAFPAPSRVKIKNSAIIEKLQANLALSPTALLPSPKSPEVKLQPAPSPSSPPPPPSSTTTTTTTTPCSPRSPTQPPSHPSSEDEEPISFQSPPEGALLPSINKTRARLSFKRRPPTRQHRRSAGDEAGLFTGGGGGGEGDSSPSERCSCRENGDRDQVFHCPEEAEGKEEEGQRGGVDASESKNCKETDGEVKRCDPEEKRKEAKEEEEEEKEGGPEEVGTEGSEPLEKKQLPSEPAEQTEGAVETEALQGETLQEENDRM